MIRQNTKFTKLKDRFSLSLRKKYFNLRDHLSTKAKRKQFFRPHRVLIALALISLLPIGLIWAAPGDPPPAQSLTISGNDFAKGSAQYGEINIDTFSDSIKLQSGEVGSWTDDSSVTLGATVPFKIDSSVNLVYGPNDTLYLSTSYNRQCYFVKYDISTQAWDFLKTPPTSCGVGTVLEYDGDTSFYYAPGGINSAPSDKFFRYDISTDSWTRLANIPSLLTSESSSTFVSQGSAKYLYLFRGRSSPSFFRYVVATDTWESLPAFPTTNSVSRGIIITWDNAGSIYAISNNTGEFKKFDLLTQTWSTLPTASNRTTYAKYSLYFFRGLLVSSRQYPGGRGTSYIETYDPNTGVWSQITNLPDAKVQYEFSVPLAYDGQRYAYSIIGWSTNQRLYRYDFEENTWNNYRLCMSDGNTNSHGALIYDKLNSAIFFHYNNARIYSYDISTNACTEIGSQIYTSRSGATGAYHNGLYYLLPNAGYNTFQSYDAATNIFNQLATLPRSVNTGMGIVDGGDGFLYAEFGGGSSVFHRYNLANDTWEALSSMPYGVSSWGGIERIGRNIYVLAAYDSSFLMKYNMDSKTWSQITNMPNGAVSSQSFITGDSSRYLYVAPNGGYADGSRKLYRYDTEQDKWLRLTDTPSSLYEWPSAFYDSARDSLYVAQGEESAAFWKWQPGTTDYVTSGSWYSETYDLTQAQTWSALEKTTSGSGEVLIYTRTSSDAKIWSDWAEVFGSTIKSPTNRYLQFKVTLQSDGSTTPALEQLHLIYTQETDAPSLPSQLTAKSKRGDNGEVLNSGQTYEYQHPYFAWSGSADGANGSGVAGYYIYYGTDSRADPAMLGSYQTNQDYSVSSPMTAGEVYYLRIKVKDNLGNISAAATYFSYRYFYISPPNSVIKTSSTDFSAGVNTNVSISDGTMSLKSVSTGTWSTGALSQLPSTTRCATMSVVGDFLYLARGQSTMDFWRYDLVNQVWTQLASVPGTVYCGSSMTYNDNGQLYLMAGETSTRFYSYHIRDDAWQVIPGGLPANAQIGSDITYIGNNKFILLFTAVREFYLYDATENVFIALQSYPEDINSGSSGIWYDGDDAIYAYMGTDNWTSVTVYNSTPKRSNMAKYSISQNSWKLLADSPVGSFQTQNNLVGDGHGNLYIFSNDLYDNQPAKNRILRYNIASDTWSTVINSFPSVYNGSATSDNQRYLYVIPSYSNSQKIVRYDTWQNILTPQTFNIATPITNPRNNQSGSEWIGGNSSTLVYDDEQYFYSLSASEAGNHYGRFVRIDRDSGATLRLPSPPTTGVSSSMAYLDGNIYYLPSKSTSVFYRYNIVEQQWRRMSDTPATIYRPGTTTLIVVKGSLYALRGTSTTAFYKYTPDSTIGSWQSMANLPAASANASAVYDPSSDSIYVVIGNGSNKFARYQVSSNNWTLLADLPASSSYGSAISISHGKAYVQRGNAIYNSYIYDIASNSWANGVDSPEPFGYGSAIIKISDDYAIAFGGQNRVNFWQFNYPSDNTSHNAQAIHTSETIIIPGIYDYAGISVEAEVPANTAVEMWTRSSADGINWDDWAYASDVKVYPTVLSAIVTSTPRLYTQIKIVLVSNDNIFTPKVGAYTLSYYFDTDPPTNPTVLSVYSNANKDEELQNNIWYKYDTPLFDWPDTGEAGGATDGPLGSNIAGYWIYVGTDITASPRTEGVFVPESQYNPTLTVPGTYYVRMQAQDVTGNVDGNIFAPFIYKFDNVPPVNPALVTVTPSGFTTKNNFSFSWPNAYDGNSGVAGYCYHTGATSGPFAIETCQTGTSIEDISAAYRSGTNVFYVRAYDVAGNYSPYYTSASYYYSTDPPTPVTNLRAIPPTSTQNLFAFTWDLPITYSGDPDQLTYCYSINTLPTPTNTTCTSDRFIAAFKAATQRGTNIIYIVAKDEANNANWNTFASANFIANTVSPGIPLNLIASDTSDRVTNRWSITLTWDEPTFIGNGIKDYIIERSLDSHTFEAIGQTSNRAYVDLNIEENITYYYRVRAEDEVDNIGGASAIVAKSAQGNYTSPPEIIVEPKASADFSQASISWVTNRASTSFVYYGTSPDNLAQSKGALESTTTHLQTLTGLSPSTTYFYRVQSFDDKRNYSLNEAYSDIYSFRTTAAAGVEAVEVLDITPNSALITWTSSVATKARLSYGPSSHYGFITDTGDGEYLSIHTLKLTGLSGGTTYHFKINSTTAFGSSVSSDDYTFTTISQPKISNIRFQPIDDGALSAVQVTWDSNVPISSTIHYSAYGVQQEISLSALETNHSIIIEGLASNSEYQFIISGRDQYGNLASSAAQNWTSSLDTRPPQISDLNYSVSSIISGSGKKAQLIIAWTTDEPSTSQVFYGRAEDGGLNLKTELYTEPTTNHLVIISNLNMTDVYNIQIQSRDLDGNTAYSVKTTVVTPDEDISIFDNILNLIVKLFSF